MSQNNQGPGVNRYNPRPAGTGYNPRPAGAARPAGNVRPAGAARPAAAARPVMQRAPRRKAPGNSRGFWKLIVLGVVVIIAGLALQVLMPGGFPIDAKKSGSGSGAAQAVSEIHSSGPVRINELMTSNGGVLTDENGATPDWIEIINTGSSGVNLGGYTLSKSAGGGNAFTFPDFILEAGECVIVFADSHAASGAEAQFHAPFRLSSAGDVLMLFNSAKVAIDTVNIPAITRNHSYARQSTSRWVETDKCTPGLANTDESYASLTTVTRASALRISEVMTSNTTVNPDENGAFHDYIVIANTGSEAADLSGWYLSDSVQTTRMWMFPEGTSIPAGGSIIVHASGLDRSASGHLHANFRLSSEGETLALSNPSGQPVDILEVPLLKDNQPYIPA